MVFLICQKKKLQRGSGLNKFILKFGGLVTSLALMVTTVLDNYIDRAIDDGDKEIYTYGLKQGVS